MNKFRFPLVYSIGLWIADLIFVLNLYMMLTGSPFYQSVDIFAFIILSPFSLIVLWASVWLPGLRYAIQPDHLEILFYGKSRGKIWFEKIYDIREVQVQVFKKATGISYEKDGKRVNLFISKLHRNKEFVKRLMENYSAWLATK